LFGGPNRYSLTPRALSLSLSVTEHTYSNNKMTSYEMKKEFTPICLFVTQKVLESGGIHVAMSVPFATPVSLPSSASLWDVTLLTTMTFLKHAVSILYPEYLGNELHRNLINSYQTKRRHIPLYRNWNDKEVYLHSN